MTIKLPVINSVQYEITLPVSKLKIKIRPFMAREEKILLMAMENKDIQVNEIKNAIIQITENCIVSEKIDVNSLTSIDIEYIFMQLRKRSVSELIELQYNLRETFDCGADKCPESIKVAIKIDDIKLMQSENVKKIIKLNDTVGVVLKPMSFNSSMMIAEDDGIKQSEKLFEIIAMMINDIFDGDELINVNDIPKKELINWVETSFSHSALEETLGYIKELPYFSSDINVVCSVCGKTKTMDVKGMIDFFTF